MDNVFILLFLLICLNTFTGLTGIKIFKFNLRRTDRLNGSHILQIENQMEKSHTQSQTKLQTLQRYHQLTSPITPFQTVKQQDHIKEQLKRNVSMKLDSIKQRSNKLFAIDTTTSMNELKAGAILYQIPEFSAPQVNYQVAEQIKKKVDEVKNEVITHLPQISRSSNYAPRKLEHQISHRSAVKQLEQWLKTKLKQPPTAAEDTIEYKNMIMGVGMKELIRLIGRRCNEEGRIAEEIWELTWGICREIILYLSKRARKCEQILQEQLGMIRMVSQKEFQRLKEENSSLKNRVCQLQEQNKQLKSQLEKIRKKTQIIEEENRSLYFNNFHLQQDFKNLLQENLAIYLQIGDKNKRGWIKKMYKNMSRISTQEHSSLSKFYREKITQTIQNRNKQEQVTEEITDVLSRRQIQQIGERVIEQALGQKNKKTSKQKQRVSKLQGAAIGIPQIEETQNGTQMQFITEPNSDPFMSDQEDEQESCQNIVKNLRQQFKPMDAYVQTDKAELVHAYSSTSNPLLINAETIVYGYQIENKLQIGVNTQQPKEEIKNYKKKEKGKQNFNEPLKRQKSKLMQITPISKDKNKPKTQKDKNNVLQTVSQDNKQVQGVKQETQILSHNSHVQEDSRLSLMTNSELDHLLNKQPVNDSFHIKISNEKPNGSKVQLLYGQPKLQIKHGKQPAKTQLVEPKQAETNKILKEPSFHEQQSKVNTNKFYKTVKPMKQKHEISMYKPQNEPISFESENKSDHNELIPQDIQNLKSNEQNSRSLIPQPTVFTCSQCKKLINLAQQKRESRYVRRAQKKNTYSPFKNSKLLERESKKSSVATPNTSLKKLGLNQIQSCHQENAANDTNLVQQRFQGRKAQRQCTKNSSGYLHDLAYKKQMEQQMKSPFGKREQNEQKGETPSNEESSFIFTKIQPQKYFISQIISANREFINSMGNSLGQSSDSSDQFLQLVKEINAVSQQKLAMTQKAAMSIIQKNLFPILNELLLVVRKAVRTNKIAETMKLFTSLPSIISNRINRKYGVKILATKHLKVILMAIKAAGKYTDKLKTIELMVFTDCKSLHSEDFFIYLLIMGLFDPTYSATRLLNQDQSYTVRRICEQHLSKDSQIFAEFDRWKENKIQGLLLGDIVKSIITSYRLLKINRIEQLGFIFLMLSKEQHWMNYKDFITFMSTFTIDNALKINITKQLLSFCDVKNRDNTIGITQNMFTKFLTSCQVLSLTVLQTNVNQQIEQYSSKKPELVPQTIDKLYETLFKIKSTDYLPNNIAEQESIPSAAKLLQSSSILDIGQTSKSNQSPIQYSSKPCTQNLKVAQKLRTYSNFTYKICNYLQKDDQTKFLSARQKKFIKLYLVLHVLDCQVDKLIGIIDYFSNSMLGLICTPLQEFSLSFKPSTL